MYRFALMMALCLGAASATAQVMPQPQAAGTQPEPQIMQAALRVPGSGQAARPGPGAPVGNAQQSEADMAADGEEGESRSVSMMLLAALALMTGIALRRWGVGQS